MAIGRKTQASVVRVSKTGVMWVLCIERAAVSTKETRLQIVPGGCGKMGLAIIL
jgi:hypothetical protein